MMRPITESIHVCCLGLCCVLASNAIAGVTLSEYSEGHGDISMAYENGELELQYDLGTDAVIDGAALGTGLPNEDYIFDPSELYVRLADTAKLDAPIDLGFLGLEAGEPLWLMPSSNTGPGGAATLGLPFLGISTEELLASDFTSATLEMTGFSGPSGAEFALWQAGLGGLTPIMQTNDGIGTEPGDDTLLIGIGGHDHYDFGFTQEGVYDIELTATAFGAGLPGGFVTDTGIFKFAVGSSTVVPEPSSLAALATLGIVGMLARRRRKSQADHVRSVLN